MAQEIKKEAYLQLNDTPYLKPISETGVGFYNLDINTAVLTFQVTKLNAPLLVSDENAQCYAYFKSENGSVSGVLDLEYKDPMNGIVTITLPTDFLQAASGSKVTGQMYITVNKWTNTPTDKSDTVVLTEFTFTVKDALINSISGVTKLEYIRMFDKLKEEIQQRVYDIEQAIANGEDYVAEMKMTLESGKKELNETVERSKTDVQSTTDQAISTVNTTRDNAVNTMETRSTDLISEAMIAKDEVLEAIDTGDFVGSSEFNVFSNDMNSKLETGIYNNLADAKNYIDGKEWQKYKLTNEDGSSQFINIESDLEAYQALEPGFYYTDNTPITDMGQTSSAGFTEVFTRSDNTVKHIIFRPYNSNQIFIKRFYNTWGDWEKVSNSQTDTGWTPFNLINGAEGNTVYKNSKDNGFDNAYRIIKNGDITIKALRVNARNLTQAVTFAELPSNFSKHTQVMPVRTPRDLNGGLVEIKPDGKLVFQYYNWKIVRDWIDTDYIYGEFSWIE